MYTPVIPSFPYKEVFIIRTCSHDVKYSRKRLYSYIPNIGLYLLWFNSHLRSIFGKSISAVVHDGPVIVGLSLHIDVPDWILVEISGMACYCNTDVNHINRLDIKTKHYE